MPDLTVEVDETSVDVEVDEDIVELELVEETVTVELGDVGPPGPRSAANVTFDPSGSLAATNVQDAIEELLAEAGGGDAHYVHTQNVPATVWTVTHNLGKHPSVTVLDSASTLVEGSVVHVSANSLTVTFGASFSGTAYCN